MKLEVSGGMITDNELLENWPSRSGMDINDKKIWFARQVIRMAQEVRLLEWVLLDHFQTWIARGFDYDYIIPITEGCYHLHYGEDVLCSSNLIYLLKDAAQADFKRRVLENLIHGVIDET